MRLSPVRGLAIVIVILLVIGAVVLLTGGGSRYKATAFLPAGNPNILEGAAILVNGFKKGKVEEIKPAGPGAELTVSLDSDVAPLHTGAVVFVQWSATVGERLVQINDGPRSNPEIPNGGRIEGNMPKPMEISDVLAGLDPASRARLGPLAQGLQKALGGSEQDVNNTLRTAGPAFTAIGNITRGLAIDGPALNQLVNDTNKLVSQIAARSPDLAGVVNDLGTTTRDTAAVRTQLRDTLHKLPPTLDQAQDTLKRVPSTVDETVPLLNDLQSATDKLPSVAGNLAPLLRDLRPTIAELKPTLQSLDDLLDETPSLLDQSASTLPRTTDALYKLTPTFGTIRPFTPCLVGFLTHAFSGHTDNTEGQTLDIKIRPGINTIVDGGAPVATSALAQDATRTCTPQGQPGGTVTGISASTANPVSGALTGGMN